MGLLDFFSKGGNDPQSQGNVNPPSVPDFSNIQQSYTNQSLSNISYPMAGASAPAPVPNNPVTVSPVSVQPQDQQSAVVPPIDPIQPVINDMSAPAAELTTPAATDMIVPTMSTPAVMDTPVQNGNGEKDIPSYEYADPSKHPKLPEVHPSQGYTTEMPEGIKVTTFEPAAGAEVPVDNSSAVSEIQPVQSEMPSLNMDNTVPQINTDVTPAPMPQVDPLDISSINNTNLEPVSAPTGVDTIDQVVSDSLDQLQNSINNVTAQVETPAPEAVAQPVVESPTNSAGALEIGVSSSEPAEEVAVPAEQQPVEVSGPIAEVVPAPIEMVASAEVTAPASPAVEITEGAMEPVGAPEAEIVDASMPTVELEKESAAETAPSTSVAPLNFEISYFRTVGFIGLNNQQPNMKVIEKIGELSNQLAQKAEAFIIDSAKGYAKGIFDSAKLYDTELTGMYLKPHYSTYSDEADLGDYENYTVMMFSSSTDKIKNIIKESDLLVMPEVTGLNNLGTLFEIWSTNSMYPGQHKPLILIGKGWGNVLTQLKTLFKLSDTDLSFVNVCQNAEEALSKITELDAQYMSKGTKQPRKIIDLREEDDEEGLFV